MTLLDFLFPERCVGCGMRDVALCTECLARVGRAGPTPLLTHAPFDYRDECIKRALWALKYKGRSGIAKVLGNTLYDEGVSVCAELLPSLTTPLLVCPVPLHVRKERQRGFNQSALIARAFVARDPEHLHYAELLTRIKHTESQVASQSRALRAANVAGAFTVRDASAVRGRCVVLIDDVITTGATMEEALGTLMRAHARATIGLAVAHQELSC